jgi:hypothetical protein
MVLVKVGKSFEVEVCGWHALFIRMGKWERYYNRLGLPAR